MPVHTMVRGMWGRGLLKHATAACCGGLFEQPLCSNCACACLRQRSGGRGGLGPGMASMCAVGHTGHTCACVLLPQPLPQPLLATRLV